MRHKATRTASDGVRSIARRRVRDHARARRAGSADDALGGCEARWALRRIGVARSAIRRSRDACAARVRGCSLRAQAARFAYGEPRDGRAADIATSRVGSDERSLLTSADRASLGRRNADEADVVLTSRHGLARSITRGADGRAIRHARALLHRRFIITDASITGLARLISRQASAVRRHPRRALRRGDSAVASRDVRRGTREVAAAVRLNRARGAGDRQRLARSANRILPNCAIRARALCARAARGSVGERPTDGHARRNRIRVEEIAACFIGICGRARLDQRGIVSRALRRERVDARLSGARLTRGLAAEHDHVVVTGRTSLSERAQRRRLVVACLRRCRRVVHR